MVRKLSRACETGQDTDSMDFQRGPALNALGKLLLAFVLIFQFAGSVHAQSVTLAWDPNVDSVLGYKVYRSEQSGSFSTSALSSLLATTSYTDATVQQGHTYYYVVTAVGSSGAESGYSSQIQVLIPVPNKAPTVNAGGDQTIALPATATLTATGNDDGLPNGTLTYQWSIVSGSGVALSSTNTVSTNATFSAAGTYTFRVTAYDGQLYSSDDVIVVVTETATTNNKAPTVNAGADQTIALPATATLIAMASDDGLPDGTLAFQWSVVSGTGVTLSSTNTASTKATFTAAGTYTFRVIASDGQLSSSDDVIVLVGAVSTTSNKGPTINAGVDQTILLPATATLSAIANDDGLPSTALTYQWMLIGGTGAAINNPTLSSVQVSFTGPGTYTFRVTVSDGQLTASDDVTVVAITATSSLTITVSKNGDTITGAVTPVYIQTTGTQVQMLELLIDGQKQATTTGTSLTYRWKTNKLPIGSHTLKANAYMGQVITATKTLTVTLR